VLDKYQVELGNDNVVEKTGLYSMNCVRHLQDNAGATKDERNLIWNVSGAQTEEEFSNGMITLQEKCTANVYSYFRNLDKRKWVQLSPLQFGLRTNKVRTNNAFEQENGRMSALGMRLMAASPTKSQT